jgi:hypothetical protein
VNPAQKSEAENARSTKKPAVKRNPPRRPASRTRRKPRWDPEPIFHELVREMHFDPTVTM